jgi:aerobic carbon-monoxide dehydrogenase small subunit
MTIVEPGGTIGVALTVNGRGVATHVEVRRTLSDFLREDLGLTGTHLGCEHGVCGACTIELDSAAVRSCLLLAVQADGATITTIEGLANADGSLSPLQEAFRQSHGFQCAFCAPGFLMTTKVLLADNPQPTREQIKEELSGNLCRCTGYHSIIESVELAVRTLNGEAGSSRNGAPS